MNVNSLYLVFHTSMPIVEDATKLRGFFGNTFRDFSILHHHDERPIYTYPRVQYKVIEGTAAVLGIEEGAKVLKEISGEISTLDVGGHHYPIHQKAMYEQAVEVTPTRDPIQYQFLTPWIGLNGKNYEQFTAMTDWADKKQLLNSILIGNLLSMSKGLDILVERRLFVASRLDMVSVMFKGIPMIGFTGEFRTNFRIPDYFGIGKGVSQGFGTVKAVKETASGGSARA